MVSFGNGSIKVKMVRFIAPYQLFVLPQLASSGIIVINMAKQETIRIYADTSVFGGYKEIAINSPLELIEYEG